MSTAPHVTERNRTEKPMYYRRMQQIRRDMQHRRAHEAQRAERVEAQREQMRAVIHAIAR